MPDRDPADVFLRRFLLLGFGLAVPLLYLAWPWLSGEALVSARLRDDAYLQFTVARNLACGRGFTFDGTHLASGVQVLWTILLAVPAAVLGPAALPQAALLTGIACHLATGALLWRLLSKVTGATEAAILVVLYLTRPGLLLEIENGQETALALLVLCAWARAVLGPGRGTRPLGLFLTCVLPWVRTDLLLFPVARLCWSWAGPRFGLRAQRPRPQMWAVGLAAGLYLLGMRLFLGCWLPPSGTAVPEQFHRGWFARGPDLWAAVQQAWWFLRPVLLGGPYGFVSVAYGGVAAWLLLAPLARSRRWLPLALVFAAAFFGASDLWPAFLGASALAAGIEPRRRDLDRSAGAFFAWGVGAFVLLALLHLPLRWEPRDYYFVPLALPASLGLILLARSARERLSRHPLGLFVSPSLRRRALLAGLSAVCLLDLRPLGGRFPWQREMELAGRFAPRLIEAAEATRGRRVPGFRAGEGRAVLGAFNAGILAFQAPFPVRALDGAVDGAAVAALRGRRLLAWFVEGGGRYLADTPRQLALEDPDPHQPHASGRELGGPEALVRLRPWVAFDLPGVGGRHAGTSAWLLYRVGPPEPERSVLAAMALGPAPSGFAVLLPRGALRSGLVLERGGRPGYVLPAPDPDAGRAPWVVTVVPARHGRLRRGRVVLVSW